MRMPFSDPRNIMARLDELKPIAYQHYQAEYRRIVENQIEDEETLERLFDHIWCFVDYEEYHALFWKLINYVETFDRGLGAFYRRIEEVHFEGY